MITKETQNSNLEAFSIKWKKVIPNQKMQKVAKKGKICQKKRQKNSTIKVGSSNNQESTKTLKSHVNNKKIWKVTLKKA